MEELGVAETWHLGKDGRDILRVDWLLASLTSRPIGFPHLKEQQKQGKKRGTLSVDTRTTRRLWEKPVRVAM